MGSRKQPNHGGSGLPHTRRSRPRPENRMATPSAPIQTLEELELYLSGNKITCLICGGEYKSLGHHLTRTHSIGARQYKEDYNIPVTRSLCGNDLKERKKAIAEGMWRENPKMENVRKRLKENIPRLNETTGKSKSSLVTEYNKVKIRKMKLVQDEQVKRKYRVIYIDEIKSAIDSDETLYESTKRAYQIYEFAKRNPEDKEFLELLSQVRRKIRKEAGEGAVERSCDFCGNPYKARHDRISTACSRECSAALRINRVKKTCVICGKEMMLIPSEAKKLTTCGSDQCKRDRRKRRAST